MYVCIMSLLCSCAFGRIHFGFLTFRDIKYPDLSNLLIMSFSVILSTNNRVILIPFQEVFLLQLTVIRKPMK